MKITTVDWLVEQLKINNYISDNAHWLIDEAKEMEKQQMRDASCPFIGGWEDDEFEYWYNETFKKK